MPLSRGYRRPTYVDKASFSSSQGSLEVEKSNASLRSGQSGTPSEIPVALTFDRIIDGGTCPPCTLRDFMNYLVYVEHDAENLQFFLWYRDYARRIKEARTTDIAPAPVWTQAMEDDAITRVRKDNAKKLRREPQGAAAELLKGTDFAKRDMTTAAVESKDEFSTPPRSEADAASQRTGSHIKTYRLQASQGFASAGLRQPFTIQPFREEISRVITTYIVDNSPRQLNLSDLEQKAVMQALAYTTHPSAFGLIVKPVESSLRLQAHPNFIRWSICNGNPARVWFARALTAVAWVLGIATLIAACKGMCVVLHGMHHRHVRPWELFVGEDDECALSRLSIESFGSANSYEDEPWVVKYRRRNIVRKVFDRELWIEEPALRQIQDTIFIQSMLCALLLAGVLTAVFVAVPGGHFF